MTVREYLDALRRSADQICCPECASTEICAHRRAEAEAAGVVALPRTADNPKRRGPGRSRQNAKNGDWYWTGTRWRKRAA